MNWSFLTPKYIILNAVRDKLKPLGITKVMLLFSTENNKYNISVSNPEGKAMKLEITEDEITTIKKMFISRIVKAWNAKYDIEPKDIICTIDLSGEDTKLEIFIQDFKDKIHKFDF